MLFIILNQIFQSELGFIELRGTDIHSIPYVNNSLIWGPDGNISKLIEWACPDFFKTIPVGPHAGEAKYWPWFWLIVPCFVLVTPLALLITLQTLTKPLGQIVTGTCVNTVLAIATLLCGITSGTVIALLSPIAAFLLGIAPQILTVPAIMVGNAVYVVLLSLLADKNGKNLLKQIIAWLAAAVAKFAALYIVVVKLICGVLSANLLASGVMKEPMLKALPATFSWPQLFTALIGGAVALLIVPVLRKALHK
jgi:hypothetical protein